MRPTLIVGAFAVMLAQITNGGTGTALPATCVQGSQFVLMTTPVTPYVCSETNTWSAIGGSAAGVPTGAIVLIVSGTCPAGYAESAALSGKFLLGTVAGAGNVGTAGGADTITPAGVNAGGAVSAHAGTAVADHASHTHTYTDVIAHTHTQASQTATTGAVSSWEHGAIDTSSTAAETLTTGSTGVATGTTAGPSATLTHSVTQASAHTVTQATFTGTAFDNRPAFFRIIACQKT